MDKDKKLIELKNLVEAAEISLQQSRQILVDLVGSQEERMLASEAKKSGAISAGEGAQVIEGIFDGQNMVGPDEKKYSVPANYASKSKLVEGDSLKLSIMADGSFVYKQINLLERNRLVGQLIIDKKTQEYRVLANNKSYRVLTASITYYKGEEGDKVTILVPRERQSSWAAVENIYKPGQTPAASEIPAESQPAKEQAKPAHDEFLSQEAAAEKPALPAEEATVETSQPPGKPEDIFAVTERVETDDVEQVQAEEKQAGQGGGLNLESQTSDELDNKDSQGLEEI